jgi:hypothetical protein
VNQRILLENARQAVTEKSKMKINAEGIFISCSQGTTEMWEFHPDDVTSVGVYREEGEMHEVIATLNKDFDISEVTSGFEELNVRLRRELKTELAVDPKSALSASGIILWPSHLAGSSLWEFSIIGKDGLASYVSPETPNALRNLSQAVRREMARLAKRQLPAEFPKPLIERAFTYNGEIGWNKDDAVTVAEWLHERGAAIVDVELWLVRKGVPQPHIKTATGLVARHYWTTTRPSETWEAFASRTLNEATTFIRGFHWPEDAAESGEGDVRFCLAWVWKEWLEEYEFRFPNQIATVQVTNIGKPS